MKTVVVTGAGGFLGAEIVKHLSAIGWRVVQISRQRENDIELNIIGVDLTRIDELEKFWPSYSVHSVIHAAACIPGKAGDLQSNTIMTNNMLSIARKRGVERFVFASSCAVYGSNPCGVCYESDVSRNTIKLSDYAVGKLQNEDLVLNSKDFKQGSCCLRISAPYGANPPLKTVVNHFLIQSAKDGLVSVFGKGNRQQHFVYCVDVARAFGLAVETNVNGVYNISGPSPISMLDLAYKCADLFNHQNIETKGVDAGEDYRGDFPWHAAQKEIGYTPAFSIEEGLHITAQEMGLL